MNRKLLIFIFLRVTFIRAVAYDRHGKDYSVNGSGDSSTMFLIVGVILLFLFFVV